MLRLAEHGMKKLKDLGQTGRKRAQQKKKRLKKTGQRCGREG
jgi:hypothetical protein